jgi:cell division protease FtsH
MPNKNERKQLFEYYSRNKKINSDVNFDKLAIRTSGLCCADIDNILNDAALMAIRKNQDEIGMKDIETSIDRVMFGTIENKLSDDTRKKIAVHEVGHAIVAIGTGQKEDLNKISLISRGQTLGFNRFSRDDVEMFDFTTKSKLFNRMMIAYGGIAAEQIVLKDITSGCVQDISDAKYIADVMIKRYGMLGITNCADTLTLSLEDGSSQKKKRKVEKLMDGLLEKALKGAIKIIKENRLLFDNLYNRLIESNVLYKEEIEEVINGVSLS